MFVLPPLDGSDKTHGMMILEYRRHAADNHLCQCGVVTARQGFAGAANAPLTGFHPTKDPLGLAAVVRQFQS